MASNRQYEPAQIFNARIVDMRHLWEPSREYKGAPTQKPNWFSMFILPKTQAAWFNEPALAGIAGACAKFQGIMQMYNYNPASVIWPIVDGDQPSPEGKSSEFAKGHWLFSGSSSNIPNIEMVQQGGNLVKLPAKIGVKSGDYVMCGVSAAIAQNMQNRIKLYLNAVVFTSPGEEIVFQNSVSGAELMRMAEQQGLRVAGFAGAPGGFGQPPGGFAPPQGGSAPSAFPGAPQPGFTPGNPGAFAQPGFVPQTAPGGFAGTPGTPATAFPSNLGQQPFPGPGQQQFAPHPGGFPQR